MKKITLNNIEYVEASELEKVKKLLKKKPLKLKNPEIPFEIGGEYFFRTVTYHYTGRLVDIVGQFLILEDCAWIADSGRFNEFFTNPSSSLEVEPYGERLVRLNIQSIVDASERKILIEVK
jgi:hypothetical protein